MIKNTCNKCKKNQGVFQRSYSGELLCRHCFMRSIENKTFHTMSKYSMIGHGEKIAVGVSGGKDSLALLHVLKRILKKDNKNEIVAITIDEGISEYRDESLSIVRSFCSNLGVPLRIFAYKDLFGVSMDEAMVQRPSAKVRSCSICGTFRRRAIDIAAKAVNADVVATGHNLDDHLQTFMINLFSGDVERVGWMYPEPIVYNEGLKKIKPFVEIYESEIVFYAFQSGIEFQSEQCPYMNESIRSNFREFLNELEKTHPGIKYNCFNSVNKISNLIRSSGINGSRASFSSSSTKKSCSKCGNISTNDVCSVCKTLFILS